MSNLKLLPLVFYVVAAIPGLLALINFWLIFWYLLTPPDGVGEEAALMDFLKFGAVSAVIAIIGYFIGVATRIEENTRSH